MYKGGMSHTHIYEVDINRDVPIGGGQSIQETAITEAGRDMTDFILHPFFMRHGMSMDEHIHEKVDVYRANGHRTGCINVTYNVDELTDDERHVVVRGFPGVVGPMINREYTLEMVQAEVSRDGDDGHRRLTVWLHLRW